MEDLQEKILKNDKKIKRLRKRNNRRERERDAKINQLISEHMAEQIKIAEMMERLKKEEQAKIDHNNLLAVLDCIKSKIMKDKGHNKQMFINVYNKYEKRYLGINRNSLYKKAPANNHVLDPNLDLLTSNIDPKLDTNLDHSTSYIIRHLSDFYKI
jgi:IS30 family transposase